MNTNDILDDLVEAIHRSRKSGISPFREYMEGPSEIIELYQAFGHDLNDASKAGDLKQFAELLDQLTQAIDKERKQG